MGWKHLREPESNIVLEPSQEVETSESQITTMRKIKNCLYYTPGLFYLRGQEIAKKHPVLVKRIRWLAWEGFA